MNNKTKVEQQVETQFVFGLFKGVVQRFEERISVDSLKSVFFYIRIKRRIIK